MTCVWRKISFNAYTSASCGKGLRVGIREPDGSPNPKPEWQSRAILKSRARALRRRRRTARGSRFHRAVARAAIPRQARADPLPADQQRPRVRAHRAAHSAIRSTPFGLARGAAPHTAGFTRGMKIRRTDSSCGGRPNPFEAHHEVAQIRDHERPSRFARAHARRRRTRLPARRGRGFPVRRDRSAVFSPLRRLRRSPASQGGRCLPSRTCFEFKQFGNHGEHHGRRQEKTGKNPREATGR